MATLEELNPGNTPQRSAARKTGYPDEVKPYGDTVLEVTYKDASFLPGTMLHNQRAAVHLEIASQELLWNYEVDDAFFCIILKDYCISIEYLFDLMFALNREQ